MVCLSPSRSPLPVLSPANRRLAQTSSRRHLWDDFEDTQPNLPHRRRSLQMGGGHPVPIGRGLRGDKSLPYTPPRCSQFRSSSLSMHLQGWNQNQGFRYPGLPPPPSLLLFPSVPSRTAMRPPVKVPPPHVVKSAETSPSGYLRLGGRCQADRNQLCQATWQ